LRLETSVAGLTGHWLASERKSFAPLRLDSAPPDLALGAQSARVLRAASTNKLTLARTLIAIIPHCAGQKQGTGFKLLENDTAIGARIHRDGLPTLVAFRTLETGEANLTGLRFTTSIAVDVSRPKLRRR